jgi:hypothetical protein
MFSPKSMSNLGRLTVYVKSSFLVTKHSPFKYVIIEKDILGTWLLYCQCESPWKCPFHYVGLFSRLDQTKGNTLHTAICNSVSYFRKRKRREI